MKIIKSTNKSKPIMLNNMRVFVPNKNKIDIIKNISKVVTGNTPSLKVKKYWCESNGFKWFSTPNFKDSVSGFLTKGSRFLTKDGASVSRICPMGTVIVSCIATVGEVAILNEDSAFNQQINGILPSEKINSLYLRYIFIYQKNNLINYAPKNVIMNINKSLFENYQISYNEDIKQQENIAYVLSTQEEQIERIKGLIKKLEKRNQYYAEKLLSGELRIRENEETGETEFYENEEWQDVVLNGVNRKIPKDSYLISMREKYQDIFQIGCSGLKNYLEIGDIDLTTKDYNIDNKEKLSVSSCKIVPTGTLLISTVRPTRGCATITKSKIPVSSAFSRYFLNGDFYPKYIINTKDFISYCNKNVEGGTYPTIKTKKIDDYQIIIHKNHTDISNKLEMLNVEIINLKKILKKEEIRFQWMLDNLLSGEYEVVED